MAAAVYAVPGAGFGGQAIYTALTMVFVVILIFFGYRFYMEHREEIFSLSEHMRALLYGCLAAAVLVLIATPRLLSSGLGTVVWLMLLGLIGWGCYMVY